MDNHNPEDCDQLLQGVGLQSFQADRENFESEVSRSNAVFRPLNQHSFIVALWFEKSELDSLILGQSRDLGTDFPQRIVFF
jgi:hypothetical protein